MLATNLNPVVPHVHISIEREILNNDEIIVAFRIQNVNLIKI